MSFEHTFDSSPLKKTTFDSKSNSSILLSVRNSEYLKTFISLYIKLSFLKRFIFIIKK
jgi:hypothetical protein